MKVIMIMFDSLNKDYLPCYGNDWVKAPNFERLAERTVTFDKFYGGSMPCMPARRELQTGRYNFLHRSWGPMEPFDFCVTEKLKENGVYSHLVTDHYHYFEDGGATYHTRFNSWELFRGQEGDVWKSDLLNKVQIPEYEATVLKKPSFKQNWINRQHQDEPEKLSIAGTFEAGIDFIKENHEADQWFLQLETFDPHEPFFSPDKYKALYPHDYEGKCFDWPPYAPVLESKEVIDHVQYEYAAMVSMCDDYLGKVLDKMDELDMWKDTMLIVNTDHGFSLSEHNWWGKNFQPFFNEVINTPFFMWDPRVERAGERTDSLAQTIDIAASLLEAFDLPCPDIMEGAPLRPAIESDATIRETALFGMAGGMVNITDGDTTYMRNNVKPRGHQCYEYTLMPTNMRSFFGKNQLKGMTLHEGFSFTEGVPVLKVPVGSGLSSYRFGHMLYDVANDPKQLNKLDNPTLELEMLEKLRLAMDASEAPIEQFKRLGIHPDRKLSMEELMAQRTRTSDYDEMNVDLEFVNHAKIQALLLKDMMPDDKAHFLEALLAQHAVDGKVDSSVVRKVGDTLLQNMGPMKDYFLNMMMNFHVGLEY